MYLWYEMIDSVGTHEPMMLNNRWRFCLWYGKITKFLLVLWHWGVLSQPLSTNYQYSQQRSMFPVLLCQWCHLEECMVWGVEWMVGNCAALSVPPTWGMCGVWCWPIGLSLCSHVSAVTLRNVWCWVMNDLSLCGLVSTVTLKDMWGVLNDRFVSVWSCQCCYLKNVWCGASYGFVTATLSVHPA